MLRFLCLILLFLYGSPGKTQVAAIESHKEAIGQNEEGFETKAKTLFGTASYYADKFNGRQTATGAIYSHDKLTAACNKLALGTWIRVTNLRNNQSVIVQVNDRLHPKNPRIVDLSKLAAQKLGYVGRGLTQVKVEVLALKRTKT